MTPAKELGLRLYDFADLREGLTGLWIGGWARVAIVFPISAFAGAVSESLARR